MSAPARIDVIFGRAVQARREALGLSRREFAELTGYHRRTIWSVETAVHSPTLRLAEDFAAALGVQPSRLLAELDRPVQTD